MLVDSVPAARHCRRYAPHGCRASDKRIYDWDEAHIRPLGFCAAAFTRVRAKVGGPDQNRTDDLLIANETLSQLSYGPIRRSNGREYEEAAPPCQGKADRLREPRWRQKPRTFNLLGGAPARLWRLAPSLASRPWRG